MFRMLKLANILFLCCIFAGKVWTADFKAAVVAHYPRSYENPVTPEERILNNVDDYEKLASERTDDYDIIVFSESTLYSGDLFEKPSDIFPYSTLVPEPNSDIVACDDKKLTYATFFKRLSCLSRELQKHVAINLAEKVSCTEAEHCPIGYYVYNTNVVFNTEGKVVARYRKFNLFGEQYMTKPELELVTFDLKPGLKIGTITCFDILFKTPAIELVRKEKVKAVVFPVMWYSELPFLTALQAQQQWARELDVILLAAGANKPEKGSGGSGVYKGKEGSNKFDITSVKISKVYYEDLTNVKATNRSEDILVRDIDKEAKDMDTFVLKKDDLRSYSSKLLDLNKMIETQVCNGKEPNRICCDFSITTTVNENILNDGKNHYQYHLVAFSGVRTFSGVATGGIESCAVVACKNKSTASCGERFEDYNTISWPITFTTIEVKSKFAKDEQKIQFPNSLRSNIKPLFVDESEWTTAILDTEGVVEHKHILKNNQQRLMTFGIFGRDFSRDGQEVTPPIKEEKKDEKEKDPKDGGGGSNFIQLHSGAIALACLLFILNVFGL